MNFVSIFRCPPGYTGNRCESQDPCNSSPCSNGGSCSTTSSGYRCDCPTGYFGPLCTLTTTICATVPCQNGGSCVPQSDGGYDCNCILGM